MSEIYTLTASSLFGIIYRTLGDKDASETVLKSVYARVWELRKKGSPHASNPFNRLRALAHRYALDYKIENNITACQGQAILASDLKNYAELSGDGLSEKEYMILKLAYLNAIPVTTLAKANNCSVDEMERRIKKIVSRIRRAKK